MSEVKPRGEAHPEIRAIRQGDSQLKPIIWKYPHPWVLSTIKHEVKDTINLKT
jgi:hypothetical protein